MGRRRNRSLYVSNSQLAVSRRFDIVAGYFYRVSIPQDILDGVPDPTQWAIPSAQLAPGGCDPFEFFNNHAIVFGKYDLLRMMSALAERV